ncbi:hypothetical protein DN730_05500 [Marinomonas piezotolerans]|uniref:Uncharacterized protein n=1 Tax=Marinomonas piezotolerans TaxID=2213058 RepID=A0A370UB98_9GAMM|nr:hypothetical protein [Marinomonas piezotolerans]RDL45073.1 hypothetical protein DN730_05500 [Marinomonas piezotolerans]
MLKHYQLVCKNKESKIVKIEVNAPDSLLGEPLKAYLIGAANFYGLSYIEHSVLEPAAVTEPS